MNSSDKISVDVSMDKKTLAIVLSVVALVLLIACFVLGIYAGGKWKKCPEIKVGTETTLVSVIVHDTVVTPKTVKEFIVSKEVIRDTIRMADTIKSVFDTSTCYSFEETEKDGAYIKAQMCSDSLPKVKPLDLRGSLIYRAAPDTQRNIIRIDTVSHIIKTPFYKDWKSYALGLVSAVFAGFLVAQYHK